MSKATLLKELSLALALAYPLFSAHGTEQISDAWKFSVTPYLWLPTINGDLKYRMPPGTGGSPEVKLGPNDYLSALNFAMMISGEARKGSWGVLTDIIYLDASTDKSDVRFISGPLGGLYPVDTGSKAEIGGLIWQLGGLYNFMNTSSVTMDALVGFRYFKVKSSLDWQFSGPIGLFPQSGSYSEKRDLLDAIVGIRGRVNIGEGNWFVPYHLDVGTGSSSFTWQGVSGLGYSMGWGDMQLNYRHLYYDQGNDKLLQGFSFSGPALSATFRF
jgi:hypothetical protein